MAFREFLLKLGGGVFAAEEGLIEGVDPGVEGVDARTQGVDPAIQAAFHRVYSPRQEGEQREVGPCNGDNSGDGVRVHEADSIT